MGRGVGMLGTARGAPGVGDAAVGVIFGPSASPGGSGCLGPESICPGFGAGGAGFDGMGTPFGIGDVRGGVMG